MKGIDFAMALPEILDNFQHYSRSYYVVFASITVFADFLVVFLLTAKKIPRDGLKLNHVMLLNLALCDIVYEILTTAVMFWPSNFYESAENCKKLYFIYLALNLSTVFNIVVESLEKSLSDFDQHSHSHRSFGSRVYWSISSWLVAFIIAYIDFKCGGLMDGNAIAFLGRFKAFGYMLFAIIFISAVLVLLLTIAFAIPGKKSQLPETTRRELVFVVSGTPQDDVVFSCSFMAIFAGWCAWVVIGVDTRIMKTVEVMKSFELTRLAARIINSVTIWHSFSHGKMQFPQRELQPRSTSKLHTDTP